MGGTPSTEGGERQPRGPPITLLLGLSSPYVAHGQSDYSLSASEVPHRHTAGRLRPILEWDAVALMTLCA